MCTSKDSFVPIQKVLEFWSSVLEMSLNPLEFCSDKPLRTLHWDRLETLAISFTPLCQCLSEETLKAVGPFYLVPMPGEVKYPTQGVNV